jgi:hypothetical protein
MLLALVGRRAAERPGALAAAFLCLATVTTLPWFAAYLMPDLLAAAVILWPAILVRRFDALGAWQRWVLGAIAAFAVVAHYGHLPLAAGLALLVLTWRALARRLTLAVAAAAILPVMFAPFANISASGVALDTPSAAPLRLPILLARSLEDGPARWYLSEACPEADYAFCRAFGGRVPDNISTFLWREDGIDSLTPGMLAAIRAEEAEILAGAFLAYPVAQTRSLLGNAARQVVEIGTGQITVARWEGGDRFEPLGTPRAEAVLAAFDRLTPVTTWAAAFVRAGLLFSGRLDRGEVEVLALVVVGLLLNAAIFGGLSAPVDRYQSRVAWLLPALAGIFLAARRTTAARVPAEGRP